MVSLWYLMMQISTRNGVWFYGCLLRLARREPEKGRFISISEISQLEHVPKHYAQQILMRLRRAGLVKSTRGTEGGFCASSSRRHRFR